MRHLSVVLLSLSALLFQPALAIQAQEAVPNGFEEWISEGLDQWSIPGLAVSVVLDDQEIYAEGFGVRKLDTGEPVDAHTQFGIASVSKHMTASALARLVDDGLITWDDRIVDLVPWFRLSDPHATAQVTIRDLLTHQVGVGRILGNRIQFMTNRSSETLLHQMRYHEFERPFRSEYVYSNVMYTLAGHVVTEVTGLDFEAFLTRELLGPMGMDRSNASIYSLDESNAAWPHQEIEGEVVEIPRRSWDNAAPAGGVNSTASDMARWMRMQLGDPGVYDGQRVLSQLSLQQIQTPQVAVPIGSPLAPQSAYGLGFNITDYEGYRLLTHGGSTDGMNSIFMLVPERNLGIFVTVNVHSSFQQAVAYALLDHHLGTGGEADWNVVYWENYQARYQETMERRNQFEENRQTDTSPSKPLGEYTGAFVDDLYGEARVLEENGGLVLRLWGDEDLEADLVHWHYDTFRVEWRNPAMREEFLTFRLGIDGGVDSMEVRFTLRPVMLQVGAYPTDYYRDVRFQRVTP